MKPPVRVYMFQPTFAPLVEEGRKGQTVRPPRKTPTRPGDLLSLREWTGKPYRSKQRVLRSAVCERVARVTMSRRPRQMRLDGRLLTGAEVEAFARADGFGCAAGMFDWFDTRHGLPFTGEVTYWPT